MAKNVVNADGLAVQITAPANYTSGQAVLLGDLFGVALSTVTVGAQVALQVEGIVRLPKASGSIGAGVRVFWDATAGRVTTTATGNRCIGWHASGSANAGADGSDIIVKLGQPNAVGA